MTLVLVGMQYMRHFSAHLVVNICVNSFLRQESGQPLVWIFFQYLIKKNSLLIAVHVYVSVFRTDITAIMADTGVNRERYQLPRLLTMFVWASYQIRKIAGCAGNAGNVFPATDFKRNG